MENPINQDKRMKGVLRSDKQEISVADAIIEQNEAEQSARAHNAESDPIFANFKDPMLNKSHTDYCSFYF
jgi:hypothetical protein